MSLTRTAPMRQSKPTTPAMVNLICHASLTGFPKMASAVRNIMCPPSSAGMGKKLTIARLGTEHHQKTSAVARSLWTPHLSLRRQSPLGTNNIEWHFTTSKKFQEFEYIATSAKYLMPTMANALTTPSALCSNWRAVKMTRVQANTIGFRCGPQPGS